MIRKISLSDFRNYSKVSLTFDSRINLIIGENGQGKTNLLEAIYYLAFIRSFRTNHTEFLKRSGSGSFYLAGEVTYQNYYKILEIYSADKKILKADGNIVSKASNFIGFIKPVVFTHDDIRLINSTSRIRRRYLDILISSVNKNYLNSLLNYTTALKSRNSLLKAKNCDNFLIGTYDEILVRYGSRIIEDRYKIISILEEKADSFIKKIKGDNYNLQISYYSRTKRNQNSEEKFLKLLNADREKDKTRAYTHMGPQMDDMAVFLNGRNLKNYGSVGQCRLASLCLKMAEAEIIAENERSQSIALIDDVTGELDTKTKDAFYSVADKFSQIFYTFSVFREDIFFHEAKKYYINDGIIRSS